MGIHKRSNSRLRKIHCIERTNKQCVYKIQPTYFPASESKIRNKCHGRRGSIVCYITPVTAQEHSIFTKQCPGFAKWQGPGFSLNCLQTVRVDLQHCNGSVVMSKLWLRKHCPPNSCKTTAALPAKLLLICCCF